MFEAIKRLPRKLAAFALASVFVMLAGWTMQPEKLSPICLGIVGLYTAFVGGHSYTDAKAKANAPAAKAVPTKPEPEEGS